MNGAGVFGKLRRLNYPSYSATEALWCLASGCYRFHPGGFMDILAAIKREERKLEKQLGKLQHRLSGIQAAAKALGHSAEREVGVGVKKRVLSAAGRAAIIKAAKKRWAKVRKQAKKVAG
jgi:hypothetical protein